MRFCSLMLLVAFTYFHRVAGHIAAGRLDLAAVRSRQPSQGNCITMLSDDVPIILLAPNASEQLGGEAMKALRIFQELKKVHANTHLVVHARNAAELIGRLKLPDVHLVPDDAVMVLAWRSRVLSGLVDIWFFKRAIALAESLAGRLSSDRRPAILHQTEPNSPVVPRFVSKTFINIFGPINGNIYYPKVFQSHESLSTQLRRVLHFPLQRLNALRSGGLRKASLVLVAGGERTRSSVILSGVEPNRIVDYIDCGISDDFLARPRIEHKGKNPHFVQFGRLVFHKGTFLVIEALSKTKNKIRFDIIGRGPEEQRCRKLVVRLGLSERVNFLGWRESHEHLINELHNYRAMVLPTMEDANGIVVQESMALGLPAICLDWGGPQLLIEDGVTGFLVEARDQDYITDRLAECMDALADDGERADAMSIAGRAVAENWRWSSFVRGLVEIYGSELREDASRR